ncbi:MAG: thioredoxin family protein [Lactobacillus sp.]|jgi:thioredoxin 1|nr:thioredoxin family protein [Lactobacillus sp.]MCI2033880.1 thioredoxin family protein [Lactobacillus sp.]
MTMAVTATTLPEKIRSGVVVLELWAPWCGPCKIMSPIMAALEAELPLRVVTMNIDEDKRIAEQFGIQSIPAMIIYRDGTPYEKIVGAYPKAKLKEHLEKVLRPSDAK